MWRFGVYFIGSRDLNGLWLTNIANYSGKHRFRIHISLSPYLQSSCLLHTVPHTPTHSLSRSLFSREYPNSPPPNLSYALLLTYTPHFLIPKAPLILMKMLHLSF